MNDFLKEKSSITKEEAAEILKTNPDALRLFEEKYQKAALTYEDESSNLFDKSVRLLKRKYKKSEVDQVLIDRIVDELLAQTTVQHFGETYEEFIFPVVDSAHVTPDEFSEIHPSERPNVLGDYMQKDISGDSYSAILKMYRGFKETGDKNAYHLFRQGLDIMDLDPVAYEILGMNVNSIGYWLPKLYEAAQKQDFFKIPETTIIKVPITLLQITRLEYTTLSQATLQIVDQYCQKAFRLDPKKEYFVKTGTYSSKFNFQNAHVKGEKEVLELGEYLTFIQYQACMMSSPLTKPAIYGVNTTNEWCVREYIADKENNPCIYHGMPLHTEYRVFIDGDSREILGIAPYWKPDIMKKRFEKGANPNEIHDYAIYAAHEETLMKRYDENKEKVLHGVGKILEELDLPGQWSLDIMQNGEDFYLIDMALAQDSALKECCQDKLKKVKENWIPVIHS